MSMESDEAREGVSYSYRPSLLGATWEFRLTGDGIAWSTGAKSGHVPFSKLRHVRMSYRPVSMQSHRFITELWAEGAPKLQIVSTSWKSLVEQERRDKPYAAFVSELHRRAAAAGATARFEQGSNPYLYWPGVFVFTGLALGLAFLLVRALQADARGAAALIGIFFLLFAWQTGNFFRRNRPGRYRPEAPPAQLMPGL